MIGRHEVIHWYTTPTELRKIADEMDQAWRKLQPGENKTVSSQISANTELRICIDQELIESPGWMEDDKQAHERVIRNRSRR
jgi:hypothetical protein